MYKTIPFNKERTSPETIQEVLNAQEGFELVQMVQWNDWTLVAILSDNETKRHNQSFGPAPMND